jgi:ferredoxin-NADP reductase
VPNSHGDRTELSTRSQSHLRVVRRTARTEGIVTLTLERADGGRLPDWTPGAHIDLVLASGVTRQYSLCGDPFDPMRYEVSVLREDHGHGGSRYIHDHLGEGTTVEFGGPRNNFRLVPSDRYVFVAGGVGITPMLPMIRQAESLGSDWRLLYLGRDRRTMAHLDAIAAFGDRVTVHSSAQSGRLDVANWIGQERLDTKVYACGPETLLDALHAHTRTWRPGWFRAERFALRQQGGAHLNTAFDVYAALSAKHVTVAPSESVATALRRAGVDVLTSCSRGVCGTCATAVLTGTPDHRDSLLDDDERASNASMFPCVSRSMTEQLTLAV